MSGRASPVRESLDAAGDSIVAVRVLDQQPALAPEPTIGTMVIGRFVYVANGQFEAHDDEGRRRPNTTLTGARLVAVRVDDETR